VPTIAHRVPNSWPDISLAEIQVSADGDLGTGALRTIFSPGALPPENAVSSVMFNAPSFQIAATVDCNLEVTVLLSAADGAPPKHVVKFLLPEEMPSSTTTHVLIIRFANWRIITATLDGLPLTRTPSITVH
jgi:hypothetical protein